MAAIIAARTIKAIIDKNLHKVEHAQQCLKNLHK
jgi:hypothetical protein